MAPAGTLVGTNSGPACVVIPSGGARPVVAGEPVVLLRDSGTGKTYLLMGLGLAAGEQGRRVPRLRALQRAVHGLRDPAPARRRRSRASLSPSEVIGCPAVC